MNSDLPSCASGVAGTPNISSFAYILFSMITSSAPEPNVLISPYSIASALALVMAGATIDSVCQTQIRSVLNIKSHSELPFLSNLLSSSSSSGVELATANGIWTNRAIKPEYIRTVDKVHGATVSVLPKNYDPINGFVSKKTKGMIEDLLQGDIDPLTVAVLVNAVYFKGNWKEQFDKTKTVNGVFHAINKDGLTEQRGAKLMKASRKMDVGMDIKALGGAHAVLLEYGDDEENEAEFGALFMLPPQNTHESMNTMISKLTSYMTGKSPTNSKVDRHKNCSTTPLHSLLQNELYNTKVNLTLPRFRVSYGVKSLKSELQNMGIKAAFSGDGMFNEMSSDPLVHLDDVYHKAVIEVTEEGTVAVAATAAVMMTRSIPRPPIELTFDRPFLMIITHIDTGVPLFISKVSAPELNF